MRCPQGHHIQHWANGGATRLENLASMCRRHHRAVHEEGYRVVRDRDGTLHFSTPRGRPIPNVPTPPAVPADPMAAVVRANEARAVAVDAQTACPSWTGERLDVGWAIDVLHPAANPPRPSRAPRSETPEIPRPEWRLPALPNRADYDEKLMDGFPVRLRPIIPWSRMVTLLHSWSPGGARRPPLSSAGP